MLVPQKPAMPRIQPTAPGRSHRFGALSQKAEAGFQKSTSSSSDLATWSHNHPNIGLLGLKLHWWPTGLLSVFEAKESQDKLDKAVSSSSSTCTGDSSNKEGFTEQVKSLSGLVDEREKLKQVRARHHGPALRWSLQEQRMQRTPVDLCTRGSQSQDLSLPASLSENVELFWQSQHRHTL